MPLPWRNMRALGVHHLIAYCHILRAIFANRGLTPRADARDLSISAARISRARTVSLDPPRARALFAAGGDVGGRHISLLFLNRRNVGWLRLAVSDRSLGTRTSPLLWVPAPCPRPVPLTKRLASAAVKRPVSFSPVIRKSKTTMLMRELDGTFEWTIACLGYLVGNVRVPMQASLISAQMPPGSGGILLVLDRDGLKREIIPPIQ